MKKDQKMNNSTQNLLNESLLCEPVNPAVYEHACNLYRDGFHITIIRDHLKHPQGKDWNKKRFEPVPEMTGVGLVTGTKNNQELYVFALDIDIYREDRKKSILQQIHNHLERKVYEESTPSGGHRIIFFCNTCPVTKAITFDFSEENHCAKHKDNIELFANLKQVLIAPSKAKNKQGEIGEYRQVSKVSLQESAILTEYEMKSLVNFLNRLSHEYARQKFQHRHKVTHEHREEIRRVHQYLKSQGFITGPLYNGERHCNITDCKNGVDDSAFDTEALTGIQLKLGCYSYEEDGKKKKFYLNCFDIDSNSPLPMMVLEQFKPVLGDSFYYEMSVSGGYHIIFKTDRPLDLNRKWKLPGGEILEVLCSDNDTVNIAPTSAYIKKYKFSGFPEYGTSQALSYIEDITTVNADTVRDFVNSLAPFRGSKTFGNKNYACRSAEDNDVKQYIRQFDTLSAINRQIKQVFPDTKDLLNFLELRHSNQPKTLYINFFSLYADDGNNPDAILFHNNNDPNNTWTGYSVQDFHSGEVLSFGHYLCKYRKDLFDNLMKKIGHIDPPVVPVNSSGRYLNYQCGKYISDPQRMQILKDINTAITANESQNKQAKIILTAPTGVGKTSMFYELAKKDQIKMILALPYTSQVLQGKASHDISGVLTGMCEKDSEIPETGSIFMTYDKAAIVNGEIDASEYIMVIDEAHNLVNHSNFRDKALHGLQQLSRQCKAVVYMTATPEYINYNDINLTIKIEQENLPLKNVSVCNYGKLANIKVIEALISQHKQGKIDVIYRRSKTQLYKMEKLLQEKSIETHVIHSDIKDQSEVYQNLSMHQNLSLGTIFKDGGVLLTTNLIIDGVNILDQNVGNLFLVDIESVTDLIQFPSRFRHGFDHYYLFVSGNLPKYVNQRSRQDLFSMYTGLALKQKESHDTFGFHLKFLASSGLFPKIALTDRYNLLDRDGNISKFKIAGEAQKAEARRMNYKISEIEDYVREYGYQVVEVSHDQLAPHKLSDIEKRLAKLKLNSDTIDRATMLKDLLNDDFHRQELIKDYLKKKRQQFQTLSKQLNISKHKSTRKYETLFKCQKCMKLLYRYCVGLELNAENPFKLFLSKYSDNDIYSMRRTHHNLMLEKKERQPQQDDKYFRFIELRDCVGEAKGPGKLLVLNSQHLLAYAKYFNYKYAAVYNEKDTKGVVQDLKDILNVEVVDRSTATGRVKEYHVKEEWSFNNIQGISFRSS